MQGLIEGACFRSLWPVAYYPWVVAGLLLVLAGGWTAAAIRRLTTETSTTRRRMNALLAAGGPPSPRLEAAARRVGVGRLVEVPASQPLACCHGLLRPQVVVSTALVDLLDDEQLTAVLAHEAAHARARDPLRVALLRSLARLAWPFPALGDLAEQAAVTRELAADHHAIDQIGRRALLEALEALLGCPQWTLELGDTGLPARSGRPSGAVGLDSMARRVEYLTAGNHPPATPAPWRLAVSTVSAAIMIAACIPVVHAVQATAEPDNIQAPSMLTPQPSNRQAARQ